MMLDRLYRRLRRRHDRRRAERAERARLLAIELRYDIAVSMVREILPLVQALAIGLQPTALSAAYFRRWLCDARRQGLLPPPARRPGRREVTQ